MHTELKKDGASLQKPSSDRHRENSSDFDQNSDLLSGESTEGFIPAPCHALPPADQAQLPMQCKGLSESPVPTKISGTLIQRRVNNTGLPDNLKNGIENLSGYAMDDVRVHYNSSKPAQFQAHAYAQGTDIHIAPRQEKHLPHEAWHVVQQKQGRVKPAKLELEGSVRNSPDRGMALVQDPGLEVEAEHMGLKALAPSTPSAVAAQKSPSRRALSRGIKVAQPQLWVGEGLPFNRSMAHILALDLNKHGYFKNTSKARTFLTKKIIGTVRKDLPDTDESEVRRILTKYLASHGDEMWHLQKGRILKDFVIRSWEDLAERVIYELKSEAHYDKELMMAMCIRRSARVKNSLAEALRRVYQSILHFLEDPNITAQDKKDYEQDLNSRAFRPEAKAYHAFIPGSLSVRELVGLEPTARTFEQSVAALHDLLEIAFRMFRRQGKHSPLYREVDVTTGEGMRERRTAATTEKAKQYALGRGIPTEVGPSYTTVRFCSINEVLARLPDGAKQSLLSQNQMKDLVWAIFAYWTLSYRKGFSEAHCFFAVYDAARNFEIRLTENGEYLNILDAQKAFGVRLTKANIDTLRKRKTRLRQGLDQAVLNPKGRKRLNKLPNPLRERKKKQRA